MQLYDWQKKCLRACLMEGMIRADCLLSENALKKHIQTASSIHEKNYGRVMLKVRQADTD